MLCHQEVVRSVQGVYCYKSLYLHVLHHIIQGLKIIRRHDNTDTVTAGGEHGNQVRKRSSEPSHRAKQERPELLYALGKKPVKELILFINGLRNQRRSLISKGRGKKLVQMHEINECMKYDSKCIRFLIMRR